jgi:uncharacterized Zn-finger protein
MCSLFLCMKRMGQVNNCVWLKETNTLTNAKYATKCFKQGDNSKFMIWVTEVKLLLFVSNVEKVNTNSKLKVKVKNTRYTLSVSVVKDLYHKSFRLGFRTEQFLQGHLKSIHQWGISDRFACNLCGKKFVTEAKLRAHEIIHTKQYPVHCSFCSKGFVTKSALKTHMVKHMAVNPWQCSEPECGKSFSTRKALESHKSFHTGRFKTTCSLCSWGGPSEAALKKHMLKHSADSNFECDKCSKKFKV